ncbi:MAG: hypothetical protein PSN34_13190 [Urechidicola sp.]|nr:hypothetical protein [Urechidicola sp.]
MIEKFKIFQEIYVEGEKGIIEMNSEEIVDLNKNSLNIYLYYDSTKTTGSIYLGIKNKRKAREFLSELMDAIGYKNCLKKLKRKL